MRLAVVIPGDNLDEPRSQAQDVLPPVEPKQIAREDPVLAPRHFSAKVGEEPWRDSCF